MNTSRRAEVLPRIGQLRDLFTSRYPLFRDSIDRALAKFGDTWQAEFEEALARLLPDVDQLSAAAAGYAAFAADLMRRQAQFEKDRTYPPKTHAESAEEVYLDQGFMTSQYLPGLLLSHYLWPHHYRQAEFFGRSFIGAMRETGATSFVEIGCGTGLYSREVLARIPSARGVGFDISPASAAFTLAHLEAFGLAGRYEMRLQDVVADPIQPCDRLVCVEVLEHLDDPTEFLRVLRAALRPGGEAFITAALNAPHIDHIYLYTEPDEVREQLVQAGFSIRADLHSVAHPPRAPGLPVPSVLAVIVR